MGLSESNAKIELTVLWDLLEEMSAEENREKTGAGVAANSVASLTLYRREQMKEGWVENTSKHSEKVSPRVMRCPRAKNGNGFQEDPLWTRNGWI